MIIMKPPPSVKKETMLVKKLLAPWVAAITGFINI